MQYGRSSFYFKPSGVTVGQSSDVMPMSVGNTQDCIADVQSLVVYSAMDSSLPPSFAQISAVDVDSEYF